MCRLETSRGGRVCQTQRTGWHLRDPACGQSIPSPIWPGPQAFPSELASRPAVKSWTRSTVLPFVSVPTHLTSFHSLMSPNWAIVRSPDKILRTDQVCSRQGRITPQLGNGGRATAELPTLFRDSPVLCCPNYKDLHARLGGRYICIDKSHLIVAVRVDCDPEKIQRFACSSAP